MKRNIITLFIAVSSVLSAVAQAPNWLDPQARRTEYPSNMFFVGYAEGEQRADETQNAAKARLTKQAQAEAAEAVQVQISSETESRSKSEKTQGEEQFQSIFESAVKTTSVIELMGLNTDSYVKNNTIYAFAYVNKFELKGNYVNQFKMNFQELESTLNTAKQLESSGNKTKALAQYQEAVLLLAKVKQAQGVLAAVDRNANIQSEKTAQYRSDIIQALARLSQGTRIYVENVSNTSLIVSTITKALSNECSFPASAEQADYVLRINASISDCYNQGAIFFCDADVKVELIKAQSGEVLYPDEFSQKGKGTNKKEATDDAYKKAGKTIGNNLSEWLKK